MSKFQRWVIIILAIGVLQFTVFFVLSSTFLINLITPEGMQDIQLVQEMPVPDNPYFTVETLLNRATSDGTIMNTLEGAVTDPEVTWDAFQADSGEYVVDIQGTIVDPTLIDKFKEELSNSTDIPIDQISDTSFQVQFLREYKSDEIPQLSGFLSSLTPTKNYKYTLAFQSFGALKEEDSQYWDVLKSLGEYLGN